MAKVEVLVGMIASGKSTYAKLRASQGAVIINDDAIVEAVHAGNYGLYNAAIKAVYKSAENVILTTALAIGRDVVVDRGVNIRRDSRRRFIGLAASLDTEINAVVFPRFLPSVHARRQYDHDSRNHDVEYWGRVARSHDAEYDKPKNSEGFDGIYSAEFIDGKFQLLLNQET
jgi:predicted kinase